MSSVGREEETLDKEEEVAENETEATDQDEATESAQDDVATYIPNYEYSVLGEKRKFADELQQFIKDETTEKRLRELHEKADGLDIYKTKLSKREEEFNSLKSQLEKAQDEAENYSFLRKHNPRKFLTDVVGIDYQALALEDAEILDRPEEDQNAYRRHQEMEYRLAETQRELDRLKNRSVMEEQTSNTSRFQAAIDARPEIKQLFDLGVTDIVDQVVEHGRLVSSRGMGITYSQAADNVIRRYGHLLRETTKQQEPRQPVARATIPNTGVSEGASATRSYKSSDELRKRARELGV